MFEHAEQPWVAHHADQGHTLGRAVIAHGPNEGMVAEGDSQLRVHRQHGVGHAGQHGLAASEFHAEPVDQLGYARRHARKGTRQLAQLVLTVNQLRARLALVEHALDKRRELVDSVRHILRQQPGQDHRQQGHGDGQPADADIRDKEKNERHQGRRQNRGDNQDPACERIPHRESKPRIKPQPGFRAGWPRRRPGNRTRAEGCRPRRRGRASATAR